MEFFYLIPILKSAFIALRYKVQDISATNNGAQHLSYIIK